MRKSYKVPKKASEARRYRRKLHIRSKLSGSAERPRICAVKSNRHISLQVIDDLSSVSLFTVSSFGKSGVKVPANREGAKELGKHLAGKLSEKNIKEAVFDRNGRAYHGLIAAVADGLRESGIRI